MGKNKYLKLITEKISNAENIFDQIEHDPLMQDYLAQFGFNKQKLTSGRDMCRKIVDCYATLNWKPAPTSEKVMYMHHAVPHQQNENPDEELRQLLNQLEKFMENLCVSAKIALRKQDHLLKRIKWR